MLISILLILSLFTGVDITILAHPALGAHPRGARLERMKKSSHYRKGKFHNLSETSVMSSKKSGPRSKERVPKEPLQAVKTDLERLDLRKDQVVWFGHSSYLLVLQGKKILVDPVLTVSFPGSVMMKAFPGTDIYQPADLPAVDLLVITHDHYDHLDRPTVKEICQRVGRVVCPLGVGCHLERWGYQPGQITELDWDDTLLVDSLRITCLPARHFSGRSLKRNPTLWASFMIEGEKTVFVGGDGGYDTHFADIGRRFPHIDLAILENGQYNEAWHAIHTLPYEFPLVIKDLSPKAVLPVHNSKFSLAKHAWDEPMRELAKAADSTYRLLQPAIGEVVCLP